MSMVRGGQRLQQSASIPMGMVERMPTSDMAAFIHQLTKEAFVAEAAARLGQ